MIRFRLIQYSFTCSNRKIRIGRLDKSCHDNRYKYLLYFSKILPDIKIDLMHNLILVFRVNSIDVGRVV